MPISVSPAVSAHGTRLYQGANSGGNSTWPGDYTSGWVAEVKSITWGGLERETIDVTSHSSGGGYRQFVNGLLNGGNVDFELNFVPTEGTHDFATGLGADFESGVIRDFAIEIPDGAMAGGGATYYLFSAIVETFELGFDIDNVVTATVSLKVAGQPDFSSA